MAHTHQHVSAGTARADSTGTGPSDAAGRLVEAQAELIQSLMGTPQGQEIVREVIVANPLALRDVLVSILEDPNLNGPVVDALRGPINTAAGQAVVHSMATATVRSEHHTYIHHRGFIRTFNWLAGAIGAVVGAAFAYIMLQLLGTHVLNVGSQPGSTTRISMPIDKFWLLEVLVIPIVAIAVGAISGVVFNRSAEDEEI
jgi:hypothetical protein